MRYLKQKYESIYLEFTTESTWMKRKLIIFSINRLQSILCNETLNRHKKKLDTLIVNKGISNVNTPATRYVLGYYTLYRLLTFRSKLNINLIFCFDKNIIYYNTLKMKKELCVSVLLSFFITSIYLGAQIGGAQTQYTVVNFGLNQPLAKYFNFVFFNYFFSF